MAIDRIVVVGCGSIGQRHARLLAERTSLEVALCEPHQQCLDEALSLIGRRHTYRDFQEALQSGPDAMVIATPHGFHAEQTIAALQAGVHVL